MNEPHTCERLTIDEDSNLIKHARREFTITGEEDWVVDHMLQVVQAFTNAGHSGGSAAWAAVVLDRLLRFKPLTDLTDDPEDWIEVGEGMWQNRRDSEAFSSDGGKTYTLLSERAALDGDLDVTPLHRAVTA